MTETGKARLHASIRGRVQGVGFRYFALENANRLGLTGWVRNRFDRSVEVLAEGDRAILENFLAILQRGPSSSHVEGIEPEWSAATGEFEKFRVRMTG